MYLVDVYLRIRRAVMVEGMSIREASRVFGLHRDTVRKMLAYSAPPGYRRQTRTSPKPKLEPLYRRHRPASLKRISGVPEEAAPHRPERIFQRLQGRVWVRWRIHHRQGLRPVSTAARTREMFVPLSHSAGARPVRLRRGDGGHWRSGTEGPLLRPGPASQRRLLHQGLSLPRPPKPSWTATSRPSPSWAEIPQSILYDNTNLAVARILGDGKRQRTRAFTEFQSHYLFEDRFGRPGKGNDKGKVEGLVGYARRNFLVPIPSFESFDALNAHLERRCLERMDAHAPGPRMRPSASGWTGTWMPCCPCLRSALRRLRQAGRPGEFPVPGPVPDQRLLGAGGLRAQRRHRAGLHVDRVVVSCGSEVIARHPALLRERRLRLRPHPLPAAVGAEDRRPGPGRAVARDGSCRKTSAR